MRYLKYHYPASDAQAICLLQNATKAGNLVVNGTLVNPYTNQCSFIANNYSQQISITSRIDASGITFTIIGTQNGIPITENVTGPNNGTTYSMNFFDVVSQVITSGAVNNVSVGAGNVGAIILHPLGRPYTLTIVSNEPNDPVGIAVYGSQDDIPLVGLTLIDNINNEAETLFPIQQFVAQTQNLINSSAMFKSLIIGLFSNPNNSADVTIMIQD